MIVNFLIPWILIILLSYCLSGLIKQKLRLDKFASFIVGFSLGPIVAGQVLYILYIFLPGTYGKTYLLFSSVILAALILLFLPYRLALGIDIRDFWRKARNLSIPSIFYFISLVVILMFALARMIFWPLQWSDQIHYYEQAHSISIEKSSTYFTRDSFEKKSPLGIRPGLPLIVDFFSQYENEGFVVEKQLQLTIFYYLLITSVALYYLISKKHKNVEKGLMFTFLLLTCFYFTKFVIFGLKEVIITSLGLSLIVIATRLFEKRRELDASYYLFISYILGAMSFVHLTGTVFAFLGGVSLILVFPANIIRKVQVGLLLALLVFFTSLGEAAFFSKWFTKELAAPPFISEIVSGQVGVVSKLYTEVQQGQLSSYGINSNFDLLFRGRLQIFTQIQFFGLAYWFTAILTFLGIKKIVKDKVGVFVGIFSVFFLFLILNPFSLINHTSGKVLAASPKYYLLLLPFLLILASYGYASFKSAISKISERVYLSFIAAILVFTLALKTIAPDVVRLFSEVVVSIHRSGDYYVTKLQELLSIYAVLSVAFLILFTITWFKNKKTENKEVIIMTYFFLVPFLFFINNNFGILQTFRYSLSNRSEKLAQLDLKNEGMFEHISELYKNHSENELILLYGLDSTLQTNYNLRLKYGEYFKSRSLSVYALGAGSPRIFEMEFGWLIRDNEVEIPAELSKGLVKLDTNDQTTLYRRNE